MILTQRLATLYATYRQRVIDGPESVFYNATSPPTSCAALPRVPFQQNNQPAQFLRQATTDPAQPGAFLVSDKFSVALRTTDPPDLPYEQRSVTGITHGDQIIYASNLFLSLVAEYAISFDDETLDLALDLLAMFTRLGAHAAGYREPAGPTHGYMLRHDAFDGSEESFCEWLGDPSNFRVLEPSYDQYNVLTNCLAFAYKILTEPDLTAEPAWPAAHRARLQAVKDGITTRMSLVQGYVASNCRYFLRRGDGLAVDRGGGACWMHAYPLARVQAWVNSPGADSYRNFDPYLATFVWSFLPDLIENFVNLIVAGVVENLPKLIDAEEGVIQKLLDHIHNNFGDFLERANKYFHEILDDITKEALDVLVDLVRVAVANPVADYLRNLIDNFPDTDISRGLNEALAVSLFRIFSRATLIDPGRQLREGDVLAFVLQGSLLLPDNLVSGPLTFHYSKELKTPPVKVRGVEIFKAHNFGKLDFTLDFTPNWAALFDVLMLPVTVPASILGEVIFSIADSNSFMSYHFFTANAAAHTFDEMAIDGIQAAERFESALFMALLHRFHGAAGPRIDRVLSTLETAPDDFPKRSAPQGWNQDFRWNRDQRGPADEGTLYNGVDFMVATMVAASVDAAANRDAVTGALEAARKATRGNLNPPGVLKLPFAGPYSPSAADWVIWDASARPGALNRPVCVGVAFELRSPGGGILLRCALADGSTEDLAFTQGTPSRAVLLPPTIRSLTVVRIEPSTKGTVLIGT